MGLLGPLFRPSLKHKKTFKKIYSEEISYIFSNKYFLMFWVMEFFGPKVKDFLSYIFSKKNLP